VGSDGESASVSLRARYRPWFATETEQERYARVCYEVTVQKDGWRVHRNLRTGVVTMINPSVTF
jgi:hypothetical protein